MSYFGVNGNLRAVAGVIDRARHIWHKWLSRRGQRHPITWERFHDLLRDYPLPVPQVRAQLWQAQSA